MINCIKASSHVPNKGKSSFRSRMRVSHDVYFRAAQRSTALGWDSPSMGAWRLASPGKGTFA